MLLSAFYREISSLINDMVEIMDRYQLTIPAEIRKGAAEWLRLSGDEKLSETWEPIEPVLQFFLKETELYRSLECCILGSESIPILDWRWSELWTRLHWLHSGHLPYITCYAVRRLIVVRLCRLYHFALVLHHARPKYDACVVATRIAKDLFLKHLRQRNVDLSTPSSVPVPTNKEWIKMVIDDVYHQIKRVIDKDIEWELLQQLYEMLAHPQFMDEAINIIADSISTGKTTNTVSLAKNDPYLPLRRRAARPMPFDPS